GHPGTRAFHPLQLMIGGRAFFVDANGQAGHVRSYAHRHEDYFAAFTAAGLIVRRCLEPRLDEQAVAMASGGLMPLAPDIFRHALLRLPEALVWELARASWPTAGGLGRRPDGRTFLRRRTPRSVGGARRRWLSLTPSAARGPSYRPSAPRQQDGRTVGKLVPATFPFQQLPIPLPSQAR